MAFYNHNFTSEQKTTFDLYLQYRRQGHIEGCLSLMSDSIVLVSEKDGTFKGKEGLRTYLKKNPFQGTWSQAYWSNQDGMIRVDGTAKVFFIPIKVKILARLNSQNKIEYVYVGRA